MPIELFYAGPDGLRINDGQFDTDHQYFREDPVAPVSYMVAGPSVRISFATISGNVNAIGWSFNVGPRQDDNNGIGLPSNIATGFSL